jgi:dolichol-phosphate mannosyltransferase
MDEQDKQVPRKTLVVLPTYNEKDNVRGIVDLILQQVPALDLLVVDDNSPDGTAAIVEDIARLNPRVHLLRRAGKLGLGTAYVEGFKWGLARCYDFFMEIDADFSHDPREIPNFLQKMRDADLVLGSRYVNGVRVLNWPFRRLVLSKAAAFYVRLITGMPVTDPTGGFKCFHRQLLAKIGLDSVRSNGYAFQIEMTYKSWISGFRVCEIPITFTERRDGRSKMSGNIVAEALRVVWILAVSHRFRRLPASKVALWTCLGAALAPF